MPAALVERLRTASPPDWVRALTDLRGHRLAPIVALELRRRDLEALVPKPFREQLVASYRATMLVNTVQVRALAQLLDSLTRRGITPLLFKGLWLADSFYPDLGARPMTDIDLLISPSELTETRAALMELSYEQRPQTESYCHSEHGVEIDLHYEFLLYPPEIRPNLVERVAPKRLAVREIATWEPNAMLMHLVVHLADHHREYGVVLIWILDIAFVVRATSQRLQVERLRALAPDESYMALLGQILGFLEHECGVRPPDTLRELIRPPAPSLSLARILRQRRLRPWGFPHPRFLRSLVAARLGIRPRGRREWPRGADIPLGWIEWLADRDRCG